MLETFDHGPVREIRLTRPPVNALNPDLVDKLSAALSEAAEQADAVILSGREGMFSAGLDVPELLHLDPEGMTRFWRKFFGLLEALARSPVPIVAAITGHAPAGGAVLTLYCDYRVMADGDYRIGLNETRVGLVVPRVIQQALVRQVGPHRAERLIVGGELLLPSEALGAGLIDELAVTPAAACTAAIDWCERHLALPRPAMLGNRRMLRQSLGALFDDLGDADIREFVTGWFDEQTQATLKALVENLKQKKA